MTRGGIYSLPCFSTSPHFFPTPPFFLLFRTLKKGRITLLLSCFPTPSPFSTPPFSTPSPMLSYPLSIFYPSIFYSLPCFPVPPFFYSPLCLFLFFLFLHFSLFFLPKCIVFCLTFSLRGEKNKNTQRRLKN